MRVALYARVSSLAQDVELSISAQLNALRKTALERGWEVVREYVDEAESGKTANRPVFQQMISEALSDSKPFVAIVVWKLNRFARNRRDSIIYKSMLRNHGLDVISIHEPMDSSPAGNMMEGVIETVDEFYSASLAEDVTRGMREAASRKFWVNSHVPYGYLRVKVQDGSRQRNRLEIDDDKATVVRHIFESAKAGIGTKEIGHRLNNDGVPSPAGKRWGRSMVHRILTNPVYKGTLVFGENGEHHRRTKMEPVRVDNAVPAIVSQAEFDAIQAQLRSRAPSRLHPRRTSSSYLFSGLLRCGECDARMVGKSAKSGAYHYYVCGSADRSGSSSCSARPVPKNKIEQAVLLRILNVVLYEPNLERLIELTNDELKTKQRSSQARLRVIEADLHDVTTRLKRLYEALETDLIAVEDIAPRLKELRSRELGLNSSMTSARADQKDAVIKLVDRNVVLSYLRDLKSLLTAGTPGERKTFINGFVKRLTVRGETVEIEYRLPLPPAETGLTEGSVLPITLDGGAEGIRTLYLFVANEALSQLSYSPDYRRGPCDTGDTVFVLQTGQSRKA